MLNILALVVVLLIFHRIMHNHSKRTNDNETELITMTVAYVVSIIVLLPIIIFSPFQGYYDKVCVDEIKLIELKSEDGKVTSYYLEQKDGYETEYIYAIDSSSEYELEGLAYDVKEKDINKVLESKECEKPIIKIFKSKPKRSLFTIAAAAEKTEVIAYVPEGTVLTNEAKKEAKKKAK